MTLAILCSGQGNQHAEMFALTAEAPAAAPVFAAAARLLDGQDPRELVRAAGTEIHANRVGQILCVTQALAAFAALGERFGGRLIVAGYSVGELASWSCAGLIEPTLTLALAGRRAAAMDAAGGADDGLAFVRGLPRPVVDELCAAHGCAVAIVNPGDAFVLGGTRGDLAALCEAAEARGASRSGALQVAVASHTARLAQASEAFRADLRQVSATRVDPRRRLLSGIDATYVREIGAGLDRLAQQVSRTIEWAGCLEACVEAGMTAALELGPGHALATMVAAAYPDVNARSFDDFRSLAGVESWLREAAGP